MKLSTITSNPFAMLLVGVVLISFSPILVQLSEAPPLQVGFYRNAFGLCFLVPFVLIQKKKWFEGKWTIGLPLIAGIFFFFDLWSWHVAIGLIGPGLATLLGNFQVFFVTLFGFFFLRERLSTQFMISVPLAVVGVFLLSQSAGPSAGQQLNGVMLCLFAAVCYATFLLITRKAQSMKRKVAAEVNLTYFTVSTLTLFSLAMLVSGESFQLQTPRAFWSLLAYGFVPHFMGWIIITRSLPGVKASIAGITLLLQPVLSLIWEVIFFKKQFLPVQLAGGVLVIVAVYLGTVKDSSTRKDATTAER